MDNFISYIKLGGTTYSLKDAGLREVVSEMIESYKSVTVCGEWQSGVHYDYLSIVRCGTASMICTNKDGSSDVPYFLFRDFQGNILKYSDGGYVLVDDEETSPDWQLIARDGADGKDGENATTTTCATEETDGLMSKEDKTVLDLLVTGSPNKIWSTDENGEGAWRESPSIEGYAKTDMSNVTSIPWSKLTGSPNIPYLRHLKETELGAITLNNGTGTKDFTMRRAFVTCSSITQGKAFDLHFSIFSDTEIPFKHIENFFNYSSTSALSGGVFVAPLKEDSVLRITRGSVPIDFAINDTTGFFKLSYRLGSSTSGQTEDGPTNWQFDIDITINDTTFNIKSGDKVSLILNYM